MSQNTAISMPSGVPDNRLAASIATTLILVMVGMLFACLFWGFAVYRSGPDTWPPMGLPRVPAIYPAISTLIILLSSGTYWAMEKGHVSRWKGWSLTMLLALMFLASQLYLWNAMNGLGLYTTSGIFASLIYAFTWIHAAHIVSGLFVLIWARPSVSNFAERVVNVGKFWHFLTLIWLIIYFALFVF